MDYFDNAATTAVDKEIMSEAVKYSCELYYNPSANYKEAVGIYNVLNDCRKKISDCLGGYNGSMIFTSSGSEADNQALFCTRKRKNSNIIISAAEHPAVYNSAMQLQNLGYEVRICPVDGCGRVQKDALLSLVDDATALVSVMHVNNETGGVNDIAALVRAVKSANASTLFHSDGVQAFGKTKVDLAKLGVDLYSISGHKIHAPKGVAALYVKKGVSLSPLIYGGGQENGLRSSTENVAGIAAFCLAAEKATALLDTNVAHYQNLKNTLIAGLCGVEEIKWISDENCVPNVVCFAFGSVRGEVMQHALEEKGVLVGTGSACSARRSHERVPKALGLSKQYADGMLRVSFSAYNTVQQVENLVKCILSCYSELKKYMGR